VDSFFLIASLITLDVYAYLYMYNNFVGVCVCVCF